MQLSKIPGSQQASAVWNKGNDLVHGLLPAGSGATVFAGALPGQADATLRKIASQYDMTNISPREFSEMLDRLKESGALSEKDFQDLAAIRMELDKEGVQADESLDLLAHFQNRLDHLHGQSPGTIPEQDLSAARRQADWLHRLAEIHAGQGKQLDVVV